MVAQYTVPVFDQVRVLTEEGDLGMLYPEMIESTHPFQITDNPLLFALSTSSKEEQQTALKAIYDQVSQRKMCIRDSSKRSFPIQIGTKWWVD